MIDMIAVVDVKEQNGLILKQVKDIEKVEWFFDDIGWDDVTFYGDKERYNPVHVEFNEEYEAEYEKTTIHKATFVKVGKMDSSVSLT